MPPTDVQYDVPAPVDAAYDALLAAVERRFSTRSTDPGARIVRFSSGPSLLTWGENYVAQVTAQNAGSTIRVAASDKGAGGWADALSLVVGASATASSSTGRAQRKRIAKLTAALFADISACLSDRSGSAQQDS